MTDAISGTTTAPAETTPFTGIAPTAAPKETAALGGLDKDAFLKLLVAQLRYQNPMSPLDGQEYLAQAAQFATVERLEGIAKAQSEAVAYQKVLLSATFVGRHVTGTDPILGTKIQGLVNSVSFTSGTPVLEIDGQHLPVDQVEEVAAPDSTQ